MIDTRKLMQDPRHFQILTLGTLLLYQLLFGGFHSPWLAVLCTFITTCTVQFICMKHLSLKTDLRSAVITALSISILFRSGVVLLYIFVAAIAILSKFTVRYNNRHIFNPANIGIVLGLVLFANQSWVSPGQWGNDILLLFILSGFAFMVLHPISKADISLFFIISYACILFGRALWLGDPLEIPLHQLQSGALFIFTFFMISDPKTTPDTRIGRIIFAFSTASLAIFLQFGFQIREGLFYALALISLTKMLFDRILRNRNIHSHPYEWKTKS